MLEDTFKITSLTPEERMNTKQRLKIELSEAKKIETFLQEQIKLIEDTEQQERVEFLLRNIDALITLVPTHSHTSCCDEDTRNYMYARCPRCFLLHAKDRGYWDDMYNVLLSIDTFEQEQERDYQMDRRARLAHAPAGEKKP